MTEAWRLVWTGFSDAFTDMAIDEAILISRSRKTVPNTVRFYRWKPSAVSLGFSQQIEKEVEVDACKELGIDIVRRPTGGGAVFHDSDGELTYSVIADLGTIPSDLMSSYSHIGQGIVLACKELGLEAQLSFDETGRQCPNIIVSGKKISGGAQVRRGGTLLQHGTMLLDTNLELMTRVLKMGQSMACMPLARLQTKVTTLRLLLGRTISFKELEDCMRTGFEKAFKTTFSDGNLTSSELELASNLCLKKYRTEEWNFKR
jgi:lipoate-protein ligase A